MRVRLALEKSTRPRAVATQSERPLARCRLWGVRAWGRGVGGGAPRRLGAGAMVAAAASNPPVHPCRFVADAAPGAPLLRQSPRERIPLQRLTMLATPRAP